MRKLHHLSVDQVDPFFQVVFVYFELFSLWKPALNFAERNLPSSRFLSVAFHKPYFLVQNQVPFVLNTLNNSHDTSSMFDVRFHTQLIPCDQGNNGHEKRLQLPLDSFAKIVPAK